MKILTAAQMAEVDRLSTEIYRIPSLLLMENAGRSVVDEIERSGFKLEGKRVLVICGKGNNGGDGMVVARHLFARGITPELVLLADPAGLRGDALTNWEMVKSLGFSVQILASGPEMDGFLSRQAVPDILVDALFGTGLAKPIGSELHGLIDWINSISAHGGFVVSVDLPSGLCADLPVIEGPTVSADLTVTFTALKPALVLPPAVDRAGKVKIAQIGSPIRLLENEQYRLNLIDAKQIRRAIPTRPRDSHKGNFGHVFVVAGSRGKSGAALMTGLAALRSGAGLVTLFLPLSLQGEFFGKCPELMTEYLPETAEGSIDGSSSAQILAHLDPAHVLIIGPGLTTEDSTQTLVRDLVHRSPVPVVLDADGINAFALQPEALRNYLGQAVIITPHPGEMARLIGRSISEVQADRLTCARGFSEKHGCFTILKGFQTLVVTPDGRIFINSTGNPGMATGGSGDILAGMVGRFVAGWQCRFRGSELQAAADYMAAAVYLHGLAGDLVAEEKGEESMIATDLLPQLPQAFKRIKQR